MNVMIPFKKTFVIKNAAIRERLIQFLYELPLDTVKDGWRVRITEEKVNKSRDQEEKYHAMIGDIARSKRFVFMGRNDWNESEIKRLLIDAFARLRAAEGRPLHRSFRIVPSLDGTGVVHLDPRSRDFLKEEASEFIEYLFFFGTEAGVTWSEKWNQDSN